MFSFHFIFLLLFFIASGITILAIYFWALAKYKKEALSQNDRLYRSLFFGLAGLLGLVVALSSAWYLKYEPDDLEIKGTREYSPEELSGSYVCDCEDYMGLTIEVIDQGPYFTFEYNRPGGLIAKPKSGYINPFLNIIHFEGDSLGMGKIVKYRENKIQLEFPQRQFRRM